jgi:ectoine hydroxylase-related dioxygenase (phytanoyl-CoA dioxygenase family)
MAIRTLDGRTTTAEEIVSTLERDGAAVLRGLADPAAMDRLQAQLRPWFEARPVRPDEFRGDRTRRVGGLVARSSEFRKLAVSRPVLDVAARILRPHCTRIQLCYTQVMLIDPGETPQPFHRDDEVWPWAKSPREEWAISGIWAATNFTTENGATRAVPGSHLWSRDRVPREDEVVSAEMAKGDLFLYMGSLLHGGGANVTATEVRAGIQVFYALAWLRQPENQYLSVPLEVARTLEPALQDLIGYAIHGRIMGEVAMEDPRVSLLGRARAEIAAADAEAGVAADGSTLTGYA